MSVVTVNNLAAQFSLLSMSKTTDVDPKVKSLWLQLIKSPHFTHVPGDISERLGNIGLTLNRRSRGMFLITYGNTPWHATVIHKSLQSEQVTEIPLEVTPSGFRYQSIVAETVEQLVEKLRPHFGTCMSDEERPGLDKAFVTLYQMKDSRLQRLLDRTCTLSELSCDESKLRRDIKFLGKVAAMGHSVAVACKNHDKNRYPNVVPYDETRVSILQEPDFYINASNVALSHQNYILSQAPMPHTLSDFWKAVIHTHCPLIVSLDSQEAYWDKVSELVTLTTCEEISDYITRRIFMTRSGASITHLECKGWEDHKECPMEHFTHLLDVIDAHKSPDSALPIWAHCSAGRGRAGTTVVGHNSRLMVRRAKERGGSSDTISCNVRFEERSSDVTTLCYKAKHEGKVLYAKP